MQDPLPLRREAGSALERALLDAGCSYVSSPSARAKTLAAVGVVGSATLLAGTAAPVFSGLAKLTWSKLVLAVAIVGSAAAVPGYYAWHRHGAARQASSGAAVAVSSARPVQSPVAPVAPVAVGPAIPAASALTPAAPRRSVARRPSALAHELAMLDAARARLARGDAREALVRLETYARTYPHGRLALEAEVLRIEALDGSGRPDAARVRARAFLARHPHSVLAARVQARLAE